MQKILFAVLLGASTLAHGAHTTGCASAATPEHDVTATMQAIFAAAKADDMPAFHAITTPDFYAYDNGALFVGDALMQLIAQAHAAGKVYEWDVTQPKVYVSCDTAWISYVNQGSLQDASGRQALRWLESANLVYERKHWRVRFVHSTRASTPAN